MEPLTLKDCEMRGHTEDLTIEEVDYHRNGVGGIGFHIVKFTQPSEGPMLGIVFPEDGAVAVFNRDKLKEDEIRFFYNSWRGDVYEPYLREAIRLSEDKLSNGTI